MGSDIDKYGAVVAELIDPGRLCDLGPGKPNASARRNLQSLTVSGLFGDHHIRDPEMAQCCVAGLWLWHDFLEESHTVSQAISSSSGSYWHGIMHRREPDYSNAKYWFRRVGHHPIYPALAEAAKEQFTVARMELTKDAQWDAFAFVDLCQQATESGGSIRNVCQLVARDEWFLLFDYCFEQAIGG